MRREWIGGKSLDPEKKRPPVAYWSAARSLTAPGETISRTRTSSMTAAEPSTIIVAESDRADRRFQIPQSILAHADEVVE
ncbi:MAG TPA: hypothetical protein VHT21_09315 [Stellaceae bacterium]|jgi:hypothetical protein|nr:hypothetical protein [Stellaceae bacterium]